MNKDHPKIISINISKGGIPKYPQAFVQVTFKGLDGDQHDHDKHYRPEQAVCLQDIEKLRELSSEGYGLAAGTTGENFTVQHLNVNQLPVGTILEFPRGLKIELSKVRKPCYVLDSIDPRLKEDIAGRCGVYAKVLVEGIVHVNDAIQVVLPA